MPLAPPGLPGNPIQVPALEATSGCTLPEGRTESVWSLKCFNAESMALNPGFEGLSSSTVHTVSLSAFQGNTQNFQYASYYRPRVSNSHQLFQLGSVQWDRLFDTLIQILLLHQDRRWSVNVYIMSYSISELTDSETRSSVKTLALLTRSA